MQVKTAMSTPIHHVDSRAPLRQAAMLMKKEDVGLLAVVKDGKLLGTLTDRDLAVGGVAEGHHPDATPVEAVAHAGLHSCHESDDLAVAARMMAKGRVRRLLVLDDHDRPSGVLSVGDLAHHEAGEPLLAAMKACGPGA